MKGLSLVVEGLALHLRKELQNQKETEEKVH